MIAIHLSNKNMFLGGNNLFRLFSNMFGSLESFASKGESLGQVKLFKNTLSELFKIMLEEYLHYEAIN